MMFFAVSFVLEFFNEFCGAGKCDLVDVFLISSPVIPEAAIAYGNGFILFCCRSSLQ